MWQSPPSGMLLKTPSSAVLSGVLLAPVRARPAGALGHALPGTVQTSSAARSRRQRVPEDAAGVSTLMHFVSVCSAANYLK